MNSETACKEIASYIKAKNGNLVEANFRPSTRGYCRLLKSDAFQITLQLTRRPTLVRFLVVGDVVSEDGFLRWLSDGTRNFKPEIDGVAFAWRDQSEGVPSGGIGNVCYFAVNEDWSQLDQNKDAKLEGIYQKYKAIVQELDDVGAFNLQSPTKTGRRGRPKTCGGDFPLNLIVFGAPGTGKSRYLNELRCKKYGDLGGESVVSPNRAEDPYFADFDRVTFYPTYSYAQFVGSYKPYMAEVDKDGFEPQQGDAKRRKVIAYKFEPGPFLRILVKAVKNSQCNYLLIIEEINRANAAAVFGDMFQLLDRCDDGKDGEKGRSEYDITPSEDVQKYLSENQIPDPSKLRIPANLYIWATMNSADQGVFPLDTAFKRRWDFKYLSLDDKKDNDEVDVKCGKDGLCKWGDLRKAINSLLARNRVNEDKHLSAYFVKPDGDGCVSGERFKMKVLMYLWEDAARMCRTQIFNKNIKTFSELMKAWDSVKPSNVDVEGKPLGGDNPLESIFCFGTEKVESVVVTKAAQPEGAGENADAAGDGQQAPEGQDGAADEAPAGAETTEDATPVAPVAEDNSKDVDAVTPDLAGDAQKNGGGQAQ